MTSKRVYKPRPKGSHVPRPAGEPRRDTLAENTAYLDKGCHLHSSCLSCPLPVCIEDMPRQRHNGLTPEQRVARDREIFRLRTEMGLEASDIAREFVMSTRAVHRIVQRGWPSETALKLAMDTDTSESIYKPDAIPALIKKRKPWRELRGNRGKR